jgi:hypothetical protein
MLKSGRSSEKPSNIGKERTPTKVAISAITGYQIIIFKIGQWPNSVTSITVLHFSLLQPRNVVMYFGDY